MSLEDELIEPILVELQLPLDMRRKGEEDDKIVRGWARRERV